LVLVSRGSSADVFRAIASPARRAILDRLGRSDLSVTHLAHDLDLSVPALSQHLRILRKAALVRERRVGRRRIYRVNAEPLRELSNWLRSYDAAWRARARSLGEEARRRIPEERWR
jgi:DNA-binding transcriptional ArsR family regulator